MSVLTPYSAERATAEVWFSFTLHEEVGPLLLEGWELWIAKGNSHNFDDGEVCFYRKGYVDGLVNLARAQCVQETLERAS